MCAALANILKSKNLKAIHNLCQLLDAYLLVGKYPEIKELESNSQLICECTFLILCWQIS